MTIRSFSIAIATASLLLTTAVASAQMPLITSVSGTSTFPSYYGGTQPDVVGFRFTADSDLTLVSLGVYAPGGVLAGDHEVGVWRDSDMMLLGSVTVTPAGTAVGDFVYEDLMSPINLTSGQSYTLGAGYTTADGDAYISGPTTFLTDGISGTVAVFPSAIDVGFVYPTNESPGNLGRIGPNALMGMAGPTATPTATATSTPTATFTPTLVPTATPVPPTATPEPTAVGGDPTATPMGGATATPTDGTGGGGGGCACGAGTMLMMPLFAVGFIMLRRRR